MRAGVVTLGTQGTKFLLQLATTVVLARVLTPQDYGLVAIVTAFTAVVGIFREAGLSTAIIQRPSIDHAQASGLFWLNVLLGTAVMVTMMALAYPVSWLYGNPELVPVTVALAVTGMISSVGIQHAALLQRRMEFKQLALRDLVAQSVGAIAGVVSALCGAGYWSLVIMQGVAALGSVASLWFACPWRPSSPAPFRNLKSLVGFGANVTGANLVGHFSKGLDTMCLGYFFSTDAVGLYNRAQSLIALPVRQVLSPIMSVARPALSRAAEDSQRLSKATIELLSLTAFASALAVAVVLPISDWLVALFLGSKWSACVPIFAALAPFAFIEPCASVLGTVLIAAGKPGAFLRWKLLSAIMIAGGLLLGLRWGPVGVAVAYAGSGVLIRTPWFMHFVSRQTGISFPKMVQAVLPSALLGGASAGVAWLSRLLLPPIHPIYGCMIVAAIATSVYMGGSSITPMGRENVRKLWRFAAASFQRGKSDGLTIVEHRA